jgi:putative transcription factor
LTLVAIEGARMFVCPECLRYGTPVPVQTRQEAPAPAGRPRINRPGKDALENREMELADDFPTRIQRAREKLGVSREELGHKINEKVSVISKLETGQMHPSDELLKKLERALNIKLLDKVVESEGAQGARSAGMTLGDYIVKKG